MQDLNLVAEKWKQRFDEAKLFEASAKQGQPKFFLTFPYPYMNGYLHVGHVYTMVRVDVMARYKRLQGYNVLFPQAWHCTGSPIENAAQRIRENEEKQWQLMRALGLNDETIKKFGEPKYWTEFFPVQAKKDFHDLGMSIDFRRSFITTDLNPQYDAFIKWQFQKLKAKGLVAKGRFPVVWCTKDNSPVGDHARAEGEGETPQEYYLMKYKFDDAYIVAATLRPETLHGDTNLWVNPDITYLKAKVGTEKWIVSSQAIEKLKQQEKNVEVIESVTGLELIGKKAIAPFTNALIPILPAPFADPNLGTGIVRSVPAHAPADWMALHDLQNNPELIKKYGLNKDEVLAIKPISMISVEGFGEFPAIEACTKLKLKNQHDPNLEAATKEVYKKEFFSGVLKERCGPYAGLKTEAAKKQIFKDLKEAGLSESMYELTGKVVCRCLTPSIVKIVTDQWFLKYSDENWKKDARECLASMTLYPEQSRSQFEYVIGWINDWACTRELGLGTALPWDSKWVIESLSDSTIYMAYYTIAHLIKDVAAEKLNEKFFDYVFFGIGEKPAVPHVEKMREEFMYWYPLDFRNSGKDLIQNHLTFSIFNHVAIFPKSQWPKGFSVNGFVTVNSEKMSKSKGNIILLRDMAKDFSADASRFTILSGGEYLDDANWDSDVAASMKARLAKLFDFCLMHYNKGTEQHRAIDDWMESKLNEIIRDTTQAMEKAYFRSAMQTGYFDLQNTLKWYLKRCASNPNKDIMNKVIKTQILFLSPFTPFFCEEIWESIGERGFASAAKWPAVDSHKINPELDSLEQVMSQTLDDVRSILTILKTEKPAALELFVAEQWKFDLYLELQNIFKKTRNYAEVIKIVMSHERFKLHAKETSAILQKIMKIGLPKKLFTQEHELTMLREAMPFIKSEFNCEVIIHSADSSNDPKAKNALPSKPAIKVTQ